MKRTKDLFHLWSGETEDRADELAEAKDAPIPADQEDLHGQDSPGAEAEGVSATDPFGLYLHQMGSIPMLNRQQELELAGRLERLRGRYRHAALCSAKILTQVADTFERIQAGDLP